MSSEPSVPSLPGSVASSEATLASARKVSMADNVDEDGPLESDRQVSTGVRIDTFSENDDVGHDHDETSDFVAHSEDENDGTHITGIKEY
jgi:hypothetical protein